MDTTLFANDHNVHDRGHDLALCVCEANRDFYWGSFEGLKKDLDYEDYLWAVQRDHVETMDHPHHGHTSRGRHQ